MSITTHVLPTPAQHSIVARHFKSVHEQACGVVVVAPATGVAQPLYDDFAHWLTGKGYEVITFDYDGIGLSIDDHVKNSKSDKLSWAQNDCVAVLDFVEDQFPDLECTWVGHSVGGHMLGMMPNTDRIHKAITVAAGTGTWWHNAPPTKRMVWFLWYFLVPVTVPFLGYFPGSRLGVLCDLPKGVIMQWRRWCFKEEYAPGYEGQWLKDRFAGVLYPITAISFEDDDMMSLKNIEDLHSFFSSAPVERVHVKPEDIDQKRIRHIGWHKKRYETLWEKYFPL
jgi:predicted alpha/beta hydrolase